MICDRDGVPELIQGMRYHYGGMYFDVQFFNGQERRFIAEQVCPSIGLEQSMPTPMQWLEVEQNIGLFVAKHYRELFPKLAVRAVK